MGAYSVIRSFTVDVWAPTIDLESPSNGFDTADPTVYLDWSTLDTDVADYDIIYLAI